MYSATGDRLTQLRAFDETKAGVKGLVDAGVSTIPSIFIHPNNDYPRSTTVEKIATIPTIDLSGIENNLKRRDVVKMIQDALETWGFFQVVNHGISETILQEMLEGVRRFFEQDDEVKKCFYTRDVSRKFVYNSNFDLYSGPATNWRDSFSCFMAPYPPNPQELPACNREILMQYSNQVMMLGKTLFELISETLELGRDHLNKLGCSEGLQVLGHYYPACPQPHLTMGSPKHSDGDFLTVLLQDKVGGLQVHHQDQWFDVPPTPGALVINIGDLLQLVTNDKFKSVEHRALSNTKGPRISVASFFTTSIQPSTRVYGPIKELLSYANPPRYRETTVKELTISYKNKGLDGTSTLNYYRLS
ncbi:1-aminocyclopropane-1-carboxylate oxidase homolog 1-like [Silene latifolia]|uniref:1-aminocyclopropane-1-carboxylate oxidase homolog 1-like n=1 Tax=Silene latifolia TaxID=37657 RepID=UPI003D78B29B